MSHPWQFNVYWYHTCSFCKHPLDVVIYLTHDVSQNKLFWKRYFNYRLLKPCDFSMNKMYIKILNLKARRVCKWCYENKPYKIGFRDIMYRETTGRSLAPTSKSMSTSEIYDWFESFNRYVRRPDAEDYTVYAT
jgi:hypothetical protein